MGKGPRRLGTLLKEAYASLGLAPDTPEMVLRTRWNEAMGPAWAPETVLDRLENGRLVVRVEYNASLTHELSMRQEEIRQRLNGFLGKDVIKEVQVKGRRFDAA